MENAAEALKTAFAVLVFVIAITVTFSMFSSARKAADTITASQDTQAYLESGEVESILYTDSAEIANEGGRHSNRLTQAGYRIVKIDDVVSTLYRYDSEKYGVTIMRQDGTVLARFDSDFEGKLRQWNLYSTDEKNAILEAVKENIATTQQRNPVFNEATVKNIYKITDAGNPRTVVRSTMVWKSLGDYQKN